MPQPYPKVIKIKSWCGCGEMRTLTVVGNVN
jgi:hypothetical protein